jgi:pimeloyl-ACP methyl ester carboxylesterase
MEPVASGLPLVKTRSVFYLIGYERLRPERIHRRFGEELERFRQTWNTSAALSPLSVDGAEAASWRIESSAPNWHVDTDVTVLDLSDLVVGDFQKPLWQALLAGVSAMSDFLFSGTVIRYLRADWRYTLFFLYPLVLLALFAAASAIVARVAAASGLPYALELGVLLGVACFALLVRLSSKRLNLQYMLLDWRFAADLVRRRRPTLEARLDQCASAFIARLRASTSDEIVVFSHSLGAALMMEIIARALRVDPDAVRATKLHLVSAGSSILKVGLHPAAAPFREAVASVVAEPSIYWAEFQANSDIFSFYKTDPVALMGIPPCGKPIVRIARIRHMLSDEGYRAIKRNPLRLHLQFTYGNERRYFYDFLMIFCGPLPLRTRIERPDREVVDAFAPDGSYAAGLPAQ